MTDRLRRTWRRYPTRTWLVWALGVVVLLGSQALLWDPGLVLLLVDPELLALVATSAVALTATQLAALLPTTPRLRRKRRTCGAGRGAGQAVTRPARTIRETTSTGRPRWS